MDGDRLFAAVALGGLLHDIGKLFQRGSYGGIQLSGPHPELSGQFVNLFKPVFSRVTDAALLAELVRHHHQNPEHFRPQYLISTIEDDKTRQLAHLVSEADHLSSSERGPRPEEWRDFRRQPLNSILAKARLGQNGPSASPRTVAALRPAGLGTPADVLDAFPREISSLDLSETGRVVQGFGDEFKRRSQGSASLGMSGLCHLLLDLLGRCAWAIPSNTQEDAPDVSLFDHLKSTGAIAGTLYRYHRDTNTAIPYLLGSSTLEPFLLAGGDLSGIQEYIFGITSAGTGGVARRLRARSFNVQLLVETVAYGILEATNMPPMNLLMSAGGKFYLLLPNTLATKEVLNTFDREVNERLLRDLNGEVSLSLASVSFGTAGFATKAEGGSGFATTIGKLAVILAGRKRRRLATLLAEPGWQEVDFLLPDRFQSQQACASCERFPRLPDHEDGLCRECDRDLQRGRLLPISVGVALYPRSQEGKAPAGIGSYTLFGKDPVSPTPSLVQHINHAPTDSSHPEPSVLKFMANYVPQDGQGATIPFDEMAAQAKGAPLLGFLKMDVDRLGELLAFGLKGIGPDGLDMDTPSRVITLSRQLDLFFTGYIQHLLSSEFTLCYSVFSGGDDLFIVGPWDRALALAGRIQQEFSRYTQNPEITISAGVAIGGSRYPIAQAAAQANEALDQSKNGGRNSITVFGHTVPWERWGLVEERWRGWSGLLTHIPSSFLYQLRGYGAMWSRYRDHGETAALAFQPHLAYQLARSPEIRKLRSMADWLDTLVHLPVHRGDGFAELDDLGLLAQLLIYSKRGTS